MSKAFTIRRITADEVVDDWTELLEFGKEMYAATFGHLYTEEQLSTYFAQSYNAPLYESWKQDELHYALYVGYTPEGKVCGFVLSSTVCTIPTELVQLKQADCGEIRRIYISPDYFGTGLAAELMRVGLDFLRERGLTDKIFLGVYAKNPRARRFYEKQGFRQVGDFHYPMVSAPMALMQWQSAMGASAE